jgi:hypothetical protein
MVSVGSTFVDLYVALHSLAVYSAVGVRIA